MSTYRILDSKGRNIPKPRAGLIPNPSRNPYASNRPRFYGQAVDISRAYTAYDRQSVIKYSRELFAGVPTLNGAVSQKADFSTLNAFAPSYRGSNQEWGAAATDFLVNKFYPVSTVNGGNYSFVNTLAAISIALDVDGEILVYAQKSRNGFPKIGLIESHRIGQRGSEDVVTEGRYKGYAIRDGIILNEDLRPLAFRILGDNPDEDYDIPAQSAVLVFEPDYPNQIRGISSFGSILIDAVNTQDIDYYLQQAVKLDSAVGLLAYTQNGQADVSTGDLTLSDEGLPAAVAQTGLGYEAMLGGLVNYFKANSGEKLEAFKTDRPHANVEAFVSRLERRCMYGLRWPYEMLNAKEIGGASVRLVQSQARNAIRARQNTLTRVARFVVGFAVATAMQSGLIAGNYKDTWYNWAFNYGELLTVDAGYEAEADRKGLLLGTTTLDEVTAKKGETWTDVRKQSEKEVRDLLARAASIAKDFNISPDKALALLTQRSPNDSIASVASLPSSTDNPA